MTETPEKYKAKTRKWEKKSWLQEKYWGELLSLRDVAELTDVGEKKIRGLLGEHGIPTRSRNYRSDSSVSPFTQFYHNKAARTDEKSRQHFDPDHETDNTELNWQKTARDFDRISDKAILEE